MDGFSVKITRAARSFSCLSTPQEMTTQADRTGLRASRREAVDACRRYLTTHLDQLRYDIALAAGWPIPTGAIEGACRHLTVD